MNNTNQTEFEALWKKFVIRLKGKILRRWEKRSLSASELKLLLVEAALGWDSGEDEGGRWLRGYTKEHPAEGELIRTILVEDMRFTEIPPQKELPESMTYILPAAGAVVGLSVATYFRANWAVKAASAIAPGMLIYPAAKAVQGSSQAKNRQNVIDGYIAQLDKYKQSVLSVLEEAEPQL